MQRLVLKVTLRDITPPIWRRLDVPADISLAQFHRILQIAMGWTNSHLHEFEQGRTLYGITDREFGVHRIPESSTRLGDVLTAPKARLTYIYDFGDSWTHTIVVESVHDDGRQELRPVVLMGARRACPAEDCGGPPGYADLLRTLADPTHPEHASMREWIGGSWDEERVPVEMISRQLAKLKLKAVRPSVRRSPRVSRDLASVDYRLVDFLKRRGRP